jgi:biotin synthase-related radical SAM superfamily protein
MSVESIRVALGSAAKLGLISIKMDVQPTNIHLLTYHAEGCESNCAFCPQSKYTTKKQDLDSTHNGKNVHDSKDKVSRVTWPVFPFNDVLNKIKQSFTKFDRSDKGFQRICIQSLNYSGFQTEVAEIITQLKRITSLPLSISIPIVGKEWIQKFKVLGVDRICFAIDTATKDLFNIVKICFDKNSTNQNPSISWDLYLDSLQEAVTIFHRGYVSTHLILGLDETEYDVVQFFLKMKTFGINTGLFAFYPMKDTRLESHGRPNLLFYRKMQLLKYLIDTQRVTINDFSFNDKKEISKINISVKELKKITDMGSAFQTSGCPGCNRPYYNEKPSEKNLIYNFPRLLTEIEKKEIYSLLSPFMNNPINNG